MFYFAYGANLELDGMKYRCPTAKALCSAILKDYRLVFRGVADVEPSPGEDVHGALWWITEDDHASLDLFEGVHGGLYRRETVKVETVGLGEVAEVMVYVMNRGGYDAPAAHYLQTIKAGYRSWQLPIGYLRDAVTAC